MSDLTGPKSGPNDELATASADEGAVDPDATVSLAAMTRHERPTPRPSRVMKKASELAAGTHVGRYVIIGTLGEGGMAVVYRAYDPDLDRGIALKCVRPESEGSSGVDVSEHRSRSKERLLREAQALAQLAHGNVVRVYDVGTF